MPYHDPEPDDPQELIGVELPGDESVTREMAESFADEFAQLGLPRNQILALYRAPEYAGAHRAWQLLGEQAIGQIVDESLAVFGRFSWIVTDRPEEPEPQPLRLYRHGS
jgi:3-mercaptopyruvate sulfurtransferase SseA